MALNMKRQFIVIAFVLIFHNVATKSTVKIKHRNRYDYSSVIKKIMKEVAHQKSYRSAGMGTITLADFIRILYDELPICENGCLQQSLDGIIRVVKASKVVILGFDEEKISEQVKEHCASTTAGTYDARTENVFSTGTTTVSSTNIGSETISTTSTSGEIATRTDASTTITTENGAIPITLGNANNTRPTIGDTVIDSSPQPPFSEMTGASVVASSDSTTGIPNEMASVASSSRIIVNDVINNPETKAIGNSDNMNEEGAKIETSMPGGAAITSYGDSTGNGDLINSTTAASNTEPTAIGGIPVMDGNASATKDNLNPSSIPFEVINATAVTNAMTSNGVHINVGDMATPSNNIVGHSRIIDNENREPTNINTPPLAEIAGGAVVTTTNISNGFGPAEIGGDQTAISNNFQTEAIPNGINPFIENSETTNVNFNNSAPVASIPEGAVVTTTNISNGLGSIENNVNDMSSINVNAGAIMSTTAISNGEAPTYKINTETEGIGGIPIILGNGDNNTLPAGDNTEGVIVTTTKTSLGDLMNTDNYVSNNASEATGGNVFINGKDAISNPTNANSNNSMPASEIDEGTVGPTINGSNTIATTPIIVEGSTTVTNTIDGITGNSTFGDESQGSNIPTENLTGLSTIIEANIPQRNNPAVVNSSVSITYDNNTNGKNGISVGRPTIRRNNTPVRIFFGRRPVVSRRISIPLGNSASNQATPIDDNNTNTENPIVGRPTVSRRINIPLRISDSNQGTTLVGGRPTISRMINIPIRDSVSNQTNTLVDGRPTAGRIVNIPIRNAITNQRTTVVDGRAIARENIPSTHQVTNPEYARRLLVLLQNRTKANNLMETPVTQGNGIIEENSTGGKSATIQTNNAATENLTGTQETGNAINTENASATVGNLTIGRSSLTQNNNTIAETPTGYIETQSGSTEINNPTFATSNSASDYGTTITPHMNDLIPTTSNLVMSTTNKNISNGSTNNPERVTIYTNDEVVTSTGITSTVVDGNIGTSGLGASIGTEVTSISNIEDTNNSNAGDDAIRLQNTNYNNGLAAVTENQTTHNYNDGTGNSQTTASASISFEAMTTTATSDIKNTTTTTQVCSFVEELHNRNHWQLGDITQDYRDAYGANWLCHLLNEYEDWRQQASSTARSRKNLTPPLHQKSLKFVKGTHQAPKVANAIKAKKLKAFNMFTFQKPRKKSNRYHFVDRSRNRNYNVNLRKHIAQHGLNIYNYVPKEHQFSNAGAKKPNALKIKERVFFKSPKIMTQHDNLIRSKSSKAVNAKDQVSGKNRKRSRSKHNLARNRGTINNAEAKRYRGKERKAMQGLYVPDIRNQLKDRINITRDHPYIRERNNVAINTSSERKRMPRRKKPTTAPPENNATKMQWKPFNGKADKRGEKREAKNQSPRNNDARDANDGGASRQENEQFRSKKRRKSKSKNE